MKRKRMLSMFMVAMMIEALMFNTSSYKTLAEGDATYEEDDVTTESSSEGTATPLTRGIYLKSGSSSIADAGNSKITASGDTVAQKVVNKIYVGVRVQRKEDGKWAAYTSWSEVKYNTLYVSTTKTFKVPGGYYYRVYSDHTANSDISDSYTNGIWID